MRNRPQGRIRVVQGVRNALSNLNENSRVELFSWSAIAHLTLCVWCKKHQIEAEVWDWQDDDNVIINKINEKGRSKDSSAFGMNVELLEQLFNINQQ